MLILYFSNNTSLKIDNKEVKNYEELKKKVIENKFKSDNISLSDLILITKGKVVNIDDEYKLDDNQTFLVKVNINIEYNKFIKDDRLMKLIDNEKTRKILYNILDNPELLEKLTIYKYQKQLDDINNMGFKFEEDKIKSLLNKNNGNIEMVLALLLN